MIAVNVLHATRNIGETIGHAKSLLVPGGSIVLSETTSVQEITTLMFGFLEGWWRFNDEDARLPGGPLLSAERWTRALEDGGFAAGECLAHETIDGYIPPQHVVVATIPSLSDTVGPPASALGRKSTSADQTSTELRVAGAFSRRSLVQVGRTSGAADAAIIGSLAQVLEITAPSFDRDTPFTEFGVDSILAVEIVDRVNERLDIALRATDLFNYSTIATLSAHIEATFGQHVAAGSAGDEGVLDVLRRLAAGEIDTDSAGREVAGLAEPV